MQNILSVDVEEWFHPESLQHLFPQNTWSGLESRVDENIDKLLELFHRKKCQATFFTLGWVAKNHPGIIKKIVAQGHEIATHGNMHKMITKMSAQEFELDLGESVKILEDVSGQKIYGFRAPTFSVVKETLWSFRIMQKLGLVYDSSVYPIWHDRYGIPDAPRFSYKVLENNGESLTEFPMSTIKFMGKNIPFGGGGYLRIYPNWLTRKGIKKVNKEGIPAIMYIHPWEFDSGQQKIKLGLIQTWRHYYNIEKNLNKLDELLDLFSWTSFKSKLKEKKLI
jgi:polysaccharide deacetylase family protein (PEP-CTERM system associated)